MGRYYDYTRWGFIGVRVINFGVQTRITSAHVLLRPLPDHCLASRHLFSGYLFDAAYLRSPSTRHRHQSSSPINLSPPNAPTTNSSVPTQVYSCIAICSSCVYRGFDSLSRRVARSASETGQSFFGVAAAGNKKTLFQGGLVERTPFTFAERATINHPNLGTQADPSHFGARAIDCHPHPLTFPSSFSCFLFHC